MEGLRTVYESYTNQAYRILERARRCKIDGFDDMADELQEQANRVLSQRDLLPIEEAY